MADLQINAKNNRGIKATPRIDLTPMVDLGFLLLTFFIMTASMTRPKAMEIQMPYKPSHENTAFYASSAITLIPAKDHRVFYYEGVYDPALQLKESGLNNNTLRTLLIQKQKAITSRANPTERHLQVLIKAHETATVEDIVGLFDEMNILGVDHMAMVDIYPEEITKVDIFLKQ